MKGRSLVVVGVSLVALFFAAKAFAESGAYLRTDDRIKTLVWNNDPKPGDAAEWTGKRDSEGYAEGPGTLTWFQTQKQSLFSTGSNIGGTKKVPISHLTGTMTHGKFEGTVTTLDRGKTYYGRYVDGQRKGNWSASPVVAKATSTEPKPATEERKKTSTPETKVAVEKKVEAPTESKMAEEAEPEPPTEGPDEASAEDRNQRSAGSTAKTATPLIAQASEADESATPRQQPVTRKAALAPGAVRAIEKPGQTVTKRVEKPKQTSEKVAKATKVETQKPAPSQEQIESPAEGPRAAAGEKAQIPNPEPEKPEVSEPSTFNAQPSAKETPADDSIRTLTGPPSSLRMKTPPASATEVAPEISTPAIAPTTASANTPKLNAVQAMDIADIEARTKGYDLGEYQLPKAEYNAADDTWSVSYIGKGDKTAKRLGVTIHDKSGKAEVTK